MLVSHQQDISEAFVAELGDVLGDDFVGMFRYGAECFPPSAITDFDAHVIVERPFTDSDRERVWAMKERLSAHVGVPMEDLDVWYVTVDAMKSSERPQTELKPGFTDDLWGIHRAHWHAGRFIRVRGPDPRDLVPTPTWEEIDHGLRSVIAEVREHSDEPGAYGVLNLCRVHYSYEMRDPVVSKLQAGLWALAFLDTAHHRAVRDAIEAYERGEPGAPIDAGPLFDAVFSWLLR